MDAMEIKLEKEREKELLVDFGDRVKMLRKSYGLTQEQVAHEIGIVPSAVGKYEQGTTVYPKVRVLLRLADFFKVSVDFLLKGEDSSNYGVHNSFNNSSHIQANNTGIIYGDRPDFTPEVAELVSMYQSLNGKDRLKLLNFAADLESGAQNK